MSYMMYESNTFPTHKDKSGNLHVLFYPSKPSMIMMDNENGQSTEQTLKEFLETLDEKMTDIEVSSGGSVITKEVIITPDQWIEDSDTGYYKAIIEDYMINEKYYVELNVSDDSNDIAVDAGLASAFDYGDELITLYAENIPSGDISITYIIFGSSSDTIQFSVVDGILTVTYDDEEEEHSALEDGLKFEVIDDVLTLTYDDDDVIHTEDTTDTEVVDEGTVS